MLTNKLPIIHFNIDWENTVRLITKTSLRTIGNFETIFFRGLVTINLFGFLGKKSGKTTSAFEYYLYIMKTNQVPSYFLTK